MQTSTTI